MIKVVYGLPKSILNKRYLSLFDVVDMDKKWQQIRSKIAKIYSVSGIPVSVLDILTADFPKLVDIFQRYLKWKRLPKKRRKEIVALFDYKKYQPVIAGFFMEPKNKFEVHVCHYCRTAYINSYGILNVYKDKYRFIKKASREELKKYIPA